MTRESCDLLHYVKPPFITHWPDDIDLLLCIDESGIRDLSHIDVNWPILSLFGCLLSKGTFFELQAKTNALKRILWPSEGMCVYRCDGKDVKRKVCLHSHEMRRMEGPFSSNVLDDKKRSLMDHVLWDKTLVPLDWRGISCIIDKRELIGSYCYPEDPYNLAVQFMLERLIMCTGSEKAGVLFEARGLGEDQVLWEFIKGVLARGTKYIDGSRFRRTIKKVAWHPKYNNEGHVICGIEVADLCAYSFGAHYLRGNSYAEKVYFKLIGYDEQCSESVIGKGYKVFPSKTYQDLSF